MICWRGKGWQLQAAKDSKISGWGSFLLKAGSFGRSCSGSVGGSKSVRAAKVHPRLWNGRNTRDALKKLCQAVCTINVRLKAANQCGNGRVEVRSWLFFLVDSVTVQCKMEIVRASPTVGGWIITALAARKGMSNYFMCLSYKAPQQTVNLRRGGSAPTERFCHHVVLALLNLFLHTTTKQKQNWSQWNPQMAWRWKWCMYWPHSNWTSLLFSIKEEEGANVVAEQLDNKKQTETFLKVMESFIAIISPKIPLVVIPTIYSAGALGCKDLFSSGLLKMSARMTINLFKNKMPQNV